MPLSQIVSASIEDGAVAPVDLSSVAQYTGFKNRLINGAMGIWQRGTSGFAASAYGPDRFLVAGNSGLTAARSTDVPSGFQYSLSINATGFPQTTQRIESLNCVDLSGQTVTVSFWAKQTSGAGAASLAVTIYYANAVDNFSGGVTTIATSTFTGTSSWAQYTATFTSLPSSVTNGIQVTVYGNTAGAATFLTTGIQLEKGVTATSFDYRPYGTELQLCQRYFEKSVSIDTAILTNTVATFYGNMQSSIANGIWYLTIPFKVTKRVAPTVTTYPYTTAANTGRFSNNVGTDYGANSAAAGGIYDSQFSVQNNSGGTLSIGSGIVFGSWFASAEL